MTGIGFRSIVRLITPDPNEHINHEPLLAHWSFESEWFLRVIDLHNKICVLNNDVRGFLKSAPGSGIQAPGSGLQASRYLKDRKYKIQLPSHPTIRDHITGACTSARSGRPNRQLRWRTAEQPGRDENYNNAQPVTAGDLVACILSCKCHVVRNGEG